MSVDNQNHEKQKADQTKAQSSDKLIAAEATSATIRIIAPAERTDQPLHTLLGVQDCYVQSSTPGMRARVYGTGSTALEVMSEMLSAPQVLEAVSKQLVDSNTIFTTLKALFPGRDGLVHPKTKVFSPTILSDALSKPLGKRDYYQSHNVSIILAELLAAAMVDLQVVMPEVGYVQMDVRLGQIPTYEDLEREVVRQSILSALERATLSIEKRRAEKITLAVLEQALTPVLLNLGRELRKVAIQRNYFRDTFHYARLVLLQTISEDTLYTLPETVIEDENIRFITSNITLLKIALGGPERTPTTAVFELPRAFESTVLALRSSPRYKVKSLKEFADPYGHVVLENYLGQPKAVVVYRDIKSEVRTQVTEFVSLPSTGREMYVQVPLENVERYLDRVMAGLHSGLHIEGAHERLVTAMSLVIDFIESPHMVSIGCGDDEIFYYALSQCDRVILVQKADKRYEFQMATEVARRAHETQSPMFNGLMHATDPGEFLLVRENHQSQKPLDVGMQTIPDDCRDKIFATPLNHLTMSLRRTDPIELMVANNRIQLDVCFRELLGLEFAEQVRITVPVAGRIIAESTLKGLRLASELIRGGVGDEAFDNKTHAVFIGTMILDVLRPVYDTPAAAELCRAVVHKLMNKSGLDEKTKKALRLQQYHKTLTMQIQLNIALILLYRTGYVTKQQCEWVARYMNENKLYILIANTLAK